MSPIVRQTTANVGQSELFVRFNTLGGMQFEGDD